MSVCYRKQESSFSTYFVQFNSDHSSDRTIYEVTVYTTREKNLNQNLLLAVNTKENTPFPLLTSYIESVRFSHWSAVSWFTTETSRLRTKKRDEENLSSYYSDYTLRNADEFDLTKLSHRNLAKSVLEGNNEQWIPFKLHCFSDQVVHGLHFIISIPYNNLSSSWLYSALHFETLVTQTTCLLQAF